MFVRCTHTWQEIHVRRVKRDEKWQTKHNKKKGKNTHRCKWISCRQVSFDRVEHLLCLSYSSLMPFETRKRKVPIIGVFRCRFPMHQNRDEFAYWITFVRLLFIVTSFVCNERVSQSIETKPNNAHASVGNVQRALLLVRTEQFPSAIVRRMSWNRNRTNKAMKTIISSMFVRASFRRHAHRTRR
jgi:hypothetical protein